MRTPSFWFKWIAALCLCLAAAGGLAAQTINVSITGSLTLVSGPDYLKLSGGTFSATTSIPATGAPVNPGASATYSGLTIKIGVSSSSISLTCAPGNPTGSAGGSVTVTATPTSDSFNVTSCPLLSNSSFTSLLNFAGGTIPSPIPLAFSAGTTGGSQATYVCGLGGLICPTADPTTLSISAGSITATCSGCPAMTLNPSSLTFTGQAGGVAPPSQSVTVGTSGTVLSYALVTSTASGGNWLTVNAPGGQTGGSFSVTVNPSTLAAGPYSGSVKVYTAASNSPQTVPITFTVTAPAFSLVATPPSFTFNSVTGGSTPAQSLAVTTSPGSSVPYTAAASTTDGNPWLSVNPTSGTTGGPSLTVGADPTKVSTGGAYKGTVTLTSTGATNSPLAVPVTFNVTKVAVSPTSFTFTTSAGGPNPLPQNLSVTSTGPSNIAYSASVTSGSSWLSLNTTSGTTNGTPLSVSVNNASLSAGSYNGSISITPSGATTPITVAVSLTVSSAPSMVPNPTSLTFTSNAGAVPGSQTINLTSSGSAISYNVAASTTKGGNWLTVSPGSGTTPGSVTVSINSAVLAGLATGTYTGNVVFTATTSAANSPLSVPITLTVTAALSPSPSSLTFNYVINGAVPAAQPVAVTSNGGAISYTAAASTTSGGNWLAVSPGSATTPTGISASVNPTSLAAGKYTGTIALASTGATNSPVTIPVTLNVISVTVVPSSLSFAGQVGGSNPASQSLSVASSAGAGNPINLSFTASASTTSGGSWLSVAPGAGTTNTTSLTVSVSTGGLAAATYKGSITVTAAGGPPVTVPVTLTIGTNVLSVLPASLSFSYQIGSAQPASQNLSVTSTGIVLNVTATPGANWLSVSPASASTPGTFSISVITTGLTPGTYNSAISLAAANASNSPVSVPVSFTVTPAPTLIVAPTALSFSYQSGGSVPAAQSFAVSTNNGGTPAMTATAATSSGGNWLTASASGANAPTSVMVSLNQAVLAGLAPGSYSGSVTVSATGYPSQTVGVALVVTAPKATILITGNPVFTMANSAAAGSSTLNVSTSDGSAKSFTAAVSPTVKWLTFSPASGTTPGSITLTVNPAGLTPGMYVTSLTVMVPGTADGSKTVTVQLMVTGSNLTATPSSLSFTYQPGGALPAAQTLAVAPASGTGTIALTSVTASVPWLKLSPPASAPGNIQVSFAPGPLTSGTYVGTIYVTGAGSPGPSLVIPVDLTVSPMPQLMITPAALSFNYEIGGSVPAPQSLAVSTDGVTLNFSVASPGTWLSVNPIRGTTPGTALVTVNPTGLGVGSYSGTISVSAYGASNPISIPVTLNVLSTGQQLVVSPSQVSFAVPVGGPAPAAQTLSVSSAGTAISFSATVSGAKWLAVTPASGTTPGSLSVAVNPAGLLDGTYTGSITVAPAGLSGGGQVVTVTLKVGTGISTPTVSAVINAASGASGTVAPGMAVAIFGTGLGPQTGASFVNPASGQTVATMLDGTQVLFDGVAVPVLYTQDGQVNAIAPFDLAGKATTMLQVEYNGVKSVGTTLQVADSQPGLFTANGSGKGQGAILNQDFSVNSPSNPAAVGSAIMLYGTGGGTTDPASTDGQINALSADWKLVLPVTVTIGGQNAQVLYYGPAPGLVGGVIQINAVIPDGTPSGNQPVVVQIGTASTTQTVTVAVK